MKIKIKDIADVISKSVAISSLPSDTRFVGLEHYETGKVLIRQTSGIDNLKTNVKEFHAGDVLVARRNVYLKRASAVDFNGVTSGDSIVLRPRDMIYGSLLPFVLNTSKFWSFAEKFADGTMSKRLSPKTLQEYEFSIPDDANLQMLSDVLWAFFETKVSYEKLLIQTNNLVMAQFVEMFGNPEENPHGYQILSFPDFATIDANMTNDYEKYADYPHIGIDSIEKDTGRLVGYRTVKEDNVKSGKYLFTSKHIIYSKIRPNLNKVALPDFDGLCSADAYPILPNPDNCNRIYLAFVLRSQWFLNYVVPLSGRSNMPKVNRDQIYKFQWPMAPLKEQEKFAAFYKQVDKSKSALQNSARGLDAMYKKILKDNLG